MVIHKHFYTLIGSVQWIDYHILGSPSMIYPPSIRLTTTSGRALGRVPESVLQLKHVAM